MTNEEMIDGINTFPALGLAKRPHTSGYYVFSLI